MSRLNHQRVVKLLGVILEDGDYSLVMELIPKGNLLTMLERVTADSGLCQNIHISDPRHQNHS